VIAPEDLALLRRVLSSGRPILVGKNAAGGSVHGSVGNVALGAKSLMLLPLMSTKGPVGVLTLISTKSARRFAGSDLAVAEDLAARIGTAIERAQLYNEAREAVQARQDILAFVSHDLKNSLMSLFLNVEMLTRSAPRDERRRGWKQLERIRRGVTQMQRMIEDLLDVGSIESGRLAIDSREHEIGELFADAVELSAPLIQDKQIEIKIETPPPPFKVRCDRERMMQVFSNLIGNAVKFVPERGTIVLSAAASGASALVAVRDTGPGIPPARLPHLFQRYWQADETARKGRGLGLFITKGIVEAQGGVIWAESQVGTGSGANDPRSELRHASAARERAFARMIDRCSRLPEAPSRHSRNQPAAYSGIDRKALRLGRGPGRVGHVPLGEPEVDLHLLPHEGLRVLGGEVEPVGVHELDRVLQPHLPGVERDLGVDLFAKLTLDRLERQSGELLAELFTHHHARHAPSLYRAPAQLTRA